MKAKKLFLLFLMALLPMVASAYDACIDGIYYKFSGSNAIVTYQKYEHYNFISDCSGDVVIPESISYKGKTYSVTSIGNGAFNGCTGLTSVSIPNSVTCIESSTFCDCTSLTSITIGNSVTSIGSSVFASCTSLTSITIPNSVTSIGETVFFGCTSLTAIIVNEGNTKYDSRDNCNAIIETSTNTLIKGCNNTIIPTSVISIGKYAFCNCSSLTSVTIPNSVNSIGEGTFFDCKGLTSVTIGNSVTSIGNSAFANCSSLTSVTIPDSVTSIGEGAFFGCKGLISVTIGNSVTSIGNSAFANCSSLPSVTIPDSVTSISESLFFGCSGLTSVTIGKSVTSIGDNAFYNCKGLTSVHITDLAAWCKIQFESNSCNPLYYAHHLYMNGKEIKELVIPDGVTSIGQHAFYGCTSLISVNIPNCVTNIGIEAFHGCSRLTSVNIGNSVTSIGDYAFEYCSGLTSVTIPDSVTIIGEYAFGYCSDLTSVTIGKSVTSIGDNAFYRCSSLTTITLNSNTIVSESRSNYTSIENIFGNQVKKYIIGNTVESIGNYTFYACKGLTSIIIGNSVTNIGSSAFSGCSGLTSINIPNSVTNIGSSAFSGCSGLTSITIGNSVTSIGGYAFSGCKGLTSITIPNSITSISEGAFEDCSSLTSVHITDLAAWCRILFEGCDSNPLFYTHHLYMNGKEIKELVIPDGVTSIGSNTFYNCSSLTSVAIPRGVTSIGDRTFSGCSGLTSVTISNSVTSIGKYAFSGCSSLTSVTIPNSVTSIEQDAFEYCSGLTSVTIPNSVTNIGNGAFFYCSDLTSITIPNSVTSIGDYAFSGCSGLTSVAIPDSVTIIGNWAFSGCKSLASVSIPNSVTNIDEKTFRDCSNLTSITLNNDALLSKRFSLASIFGNQVKEYMIGDDVKTIGECAFQGCSNLALITISGSVTSIGNSAFYGCSSLTSVTIPESVTNIGNYAFQNCSGLASVDILNGVSSIGENAFYGCNGLTSVIIPNSVTSIGIFAFGSCSSLTSIIVKEGNTKYDSRDKCNALIETSTNTLIIGCKNTVIPNSVTSIGYSAFVSCSSLTSITIPNSVTSIGERAFGGCGSLTSVTIPNSVTNIGGSAFFGCTGLESVTIGSSVTSIGSNAFFDCGSLTDVYCYAEQVPNTPGNIFDIPLVSSAVLHVPASSVEVYRAKAPWSGFGSIVPLEGESEDDNYINGIYYDFSDNEAKVIKGENPYSGDVVIPASVTYKGKTYNVTSIGDMAFFQCNGLTSVTIPNSVQTIGELAFATCSGLTSIYIPESVTTIGVGAFAECTGLTSISIPESMTAISESLFSGCSNLTSVIIPKGVTSIGEEAFAYCSKLKNVYCYAEQVPNTTDNAFGNTPIQSAVLQVPTSSAKEQYKKTTPWSGFGTIKAQVDGEFTVDGPQLENSSFDEWHVVGSGNQALYNPWKEGGSSYWDTGNRGTTTVGASNSTYGIEDGRTYANLQSKFIVIKFAAGNIFTGSYLKTDGSNGILSLGRPFTGRPSKLQFDYTYKSSIVNKGGNKWEEKYSRYISKETYDGLRGQPDSCCIWVALIGDKDEEVFDGVTYPFIIRTRPSDLHLFDPNSENVIAYGQFTSGDDQLEWGTRTIDIQYRNDRTPKYIIVVATSSKYGDYFVGGDASLLKLDNLKLLYDDPIPIEKETFFAELANGVQMEFKVISKENKTCQVGTGTRPCISIDTSGEISIPSEVEGYTVVAVGEKAFDDCSKLTAITIPNSVTSIGGSAFSGCRLRNVLLRSMTPPAIDEEAFSKNIYNHTTLYIPNGSWDEYVFNSNWYQFINIRETTIVEEQLSMQQTYTLMDANTFAYSVYDPVNDCIGAVGVVNEDNPNHCWQVIEADGNHYLYNLGAKKFVASYGNSLNLTNDVTAIEMGNGKNGITFGKQEGKQWAFVSNERMNVEQSIADAIIAMQGTSLSRQTGADIYDLQGLRLSAPQKGLNIIRMTDGTTRKVMIK